MKNIEGFNRIFLKNIITDINATTDDYGKLVGANLIFNPIHENMIYHKTDGKTVPFFPENLTISLDMKGVIKLSSLCLEVISSYLYNIRTKVFKKDLIEIIDTKDPKRYIKVRVSSMFFREEEKGRYKISIAVIQRGNDIIDDQEIVNINFSKRDVSTLVSLLRRITSSYTRVSGSSVEMQMVSKETGEIVDTKIGSIAKIDSSLLINNIWLHGQELLNVMYTLDELIYTLYIEKELENLHSIYRQTKFTKKEDILYFIVKKMNGEHQEEENLIDGEDCYIRIPCTGHLLTLFFLFLDVSVLRHADFESDEEHIEILGSQKVNLGDKVKFHISMKESFMGIAIKPRKNKDETKISLVGKVKDGQFREENSVSDILENYIKKYDANGDKIIVPVLTEFQIDLKEQWPKLISALSMAYTKEYVEEDKEWNMVKFFVINQDNTGKYKYEFTIFADKGNKAPAVLIIEKFRIKAGNEIEFMSRYRQPLFKKYVYQLISIILTASEDIEKISLIEDMNLKSTIQYQYKSMKKIKEIKKDKEIRYGFIKSEDGVNLGNFAEEEGIVELDIQDIVLLNLSSYYRLTKGMWIPFVGNKVSIGQDGYLTDMSREVNMELDKKGTYWATKIFFGTAL